jgi:hypothetical protein
MVTFRTALDKARETPKSYKIVTGSYLPKSLVTIEVLWEEDSAPFYGAKKLIEKQIVNVTMPKWLANR